MWLNSEMPLAEVTDLLEPYPSEELNAYAISAAIKSPETNGPELLRPIGQRLVPEYDYEIYSHLSLQGMGMTQARQRPKILECCCTHATEYAQLLQLALWHSIA